MQPWSMCPPRHGAVRDTQLCATALGHAKPDKLQRVLMCTMPRAELLGLLTELLQERVEQDRLEEAGLFLDCKG